MPVVGTLYLFNEALCFYSSLSASNLFDGSKTVIKLTYAEMSNVVLEPNGVSKCISIMLNGQVDQKFFKFQKSYNFNQLAQITVYINEMLESLRQIQNQNEEKENQI
jgi:hypothetical protein